MPIPVARPRSAQERPVPDARVGEVARWTVGGDEKGHPSIIKRRESTSKLVAQSMDGAEDPFLSFSNIENADSVATIFGDIDIISSSR